MTSTEMEKSGDPEFCWGKKRGVGGKKKEVQFYESFTYDGVEYALYDCVYMQNKDSEAEPHIGKIIKIWSNPGDSKKIKIQWFFRPTDISYWLQNQDVVAMENELFFAGGEGRGLANINPLEAISGKCFVVCISSDIRNPQPSAEQLQMADYVFHRIFDVGDCIILDKMDDKVGGLEVRFVFNRQKNEVIAAPKLGSELKEGDNRIAVVYEENLPCLGKRPHEVLESIKSEGNNNHLVTKEDAEATNLMVKDKTSSGHAEGSLDHLKPTLGKRPGTAVNALSSEVVTSTREKNNSADVIGASGQFKDSMLLASQKLVGKTRECEPPNLDGRPSKRTKLDNSTKVTKDKNVTKIEKLTSNREDVNASRVVSSKGKTKPETENIDVGLGKNTKAIRDSITLDDRLLKKSKESVKLTEDKNKNNLEKANIRSGGSEQKGILVAESLVEDNRKAKLAKSSAELHNVPSKEKPNSKLIENLSGSNKTHIKEMPEEKMSKLTKNCSKLDMCPSSKMGEEKMCEHSSDFIGLDKGPYEEKPSTKTRMLTDRPFGLEKGLLEDKLDEEITMLLKNNSHGIPEALVEVDEKIDGKIYEVIQKPKADTCSWLSISWENRIARAHEQRRLVLLQNLDPEYTSGEIEDIVWTAFDEKCTAKMVQRTAISCPHYGQALVIFNTREAAKMVVGKLNAGCLIISNHRPLVGCMANLHCLEGKQSTFVGHFTIENLTGDKPKLQMQREQRDAVSTPHFSQPNSVEYELSMEWCLLQARSSYWWERLHKQQAKEFKKLISKYKSDLMREEI